MPRANLTSYFEDRDLRNAWRAGWGAMLAPGMETLRHRARLYRENYLEAAKLYIETKTAQGLLPKKDVLIYILARDTFDFIENDIIEEVFGRNVAMLHAEIKAIEKLAHSQQGVPPGFTVSALAQETVTAVYDTGGARAFETRAQANAERKTQDFAAILSRFNPDRLKPN